MRRVLIVLLGLGVFFGYGSALAAARWHWRAHHGGGCESRWRGHHGLDERSERFEAPRPAVAPQAVSPAPAAAPASQQIFLVMPGAQAPAAAAPQIITVPALQAPLPAPAPAQAR